MTMHTDSQNAADFYDFEGALTPEERKVLVRTREFMRDQVAPLVAEHWAEGVFPVELIGRFRESGLVGLPYEGYGDHGPVASHNQVKGFVVGKGPPGFTAVKIANKISLRLVEKRTSSSRTSASRRATGCRTRPPSVTSPRFCAPRAAVSPGRRWA